MVAGDQGIFEATVRSGRIPERAWRALAAVALFLLLIALTEPKTNWPLGLSVLAAFAILRWWHRRSWNGAAVFLLQRHEIGDGEWQGILLLRPSLELLPESISHLKLEMVDRRGRAQTVWQDSLPLEPSVDVAALALSFEPPLPPEGRESRWVLSVEVNTSSGKVTIESRIPVSPGGENEANDL